MQDNDLLKLLVCGGRDVHITGQGRRALVQLWEDGAFGELVHGGARGVDADAKRIAEEQRWPARIFRPDYDRYGRRAPLERNTEMAEYVGSKGACIAFPGGNGTKNMMSKAIAAGMTVYVWDRYTRRLVRRSGFVAS